MKAYKTEINPTTKQVIFFNACAGTSRFVFNLYLGIKHDLYYKYGKQSCSAYSFDKELNKIKKDVYPWMYDVPSCIIQTTEQNVDLAFKNFFRRVKQGEKPGYPKFKNKFKTKKSFKFVGNLKVTTNKIKVPKIGWVELKESNYIPINIKPKSMTISERAGRWFVSVLIDEDTKIDCNLKKVIGIDVGIKILASCSTGKEYKNNKYGYEHERKIKRLNKKLARQKLGSNRRNKTKIKLQKEYYRMSCKRNDDIHKMTTEIVNKNPEIIVLENLKIKNMMKNHKLSKSIADASFFTIKQYLKYKGEQRGIEILEVDTMFPSTQLCSYCGNRKTGVNKMQLKDRVYKCSVCGLEIDRDYNAALNLKKYGEDQRNLRTGRLEVTNK